MEHHLTATECHLPYGITQCYLPPDTSEHTRPSHHRQSGRYSIYLPRRDGRLSWLRWLVTHQDGLSFVATKSVTEWMISRLLCVRSVTSWSTAKATQGGYPGWRHPATVVTFNFQCGRHVGSRTAGVDYCNATVTGNYLLHCYLIFIGEQILGNY